MKAVRTEAVKAALEFFCQRTVPAESPGVITHLKNLVGAGLVSSAEWLFLKHQERLTAFTLEEILPASPSVKALDAWLDRRPDQSKDLAEMRRLVSEAPSLALQSVVAHWFFEKAAAKEFVQGVEALLLKLETKPFVPQSSLLDVALRRDKEGAFGVQLLEGAQKTEGALGRLLGSIGSDLKALETFTASLAKIVDSLAPDIVKQILPLLFQDLDTSDGPTRRRLSGQMLKLAEGLMAKKRSPNVHSFLLALDHLTATLERQSDFIRYGEDMCGVRYFAAPRQTNNAKISHEGAELVALAIEKLHLGDDPLLVLEATAFNLGLRSFGELGTKTSYDPLLHEDIVGGIKPGTEVQFTRKGWKRDHRVIARAKVNLPSA